MSLAGPVPQSMALAIPGEPYFQACLVPAVEPLQASLAGTQPASA